jgi:hypothetical protein
MSRFLIVRGDDLVHIGLEWSEFRLDMRGNRPQLVALSDRARVTLSFPPQVIAEGLVKPIGMGAWTGLWTVAGRLSGPSRVQFAVPAGTSMELNADGVFKALIGPGVSVVSRGSAAGDEPTAIEIPWGLIVSAASAVGGRDVVSDHAVLPAKSPSGVTGLWRACLRASDHDAEDAGLTLLPLRYLPGDIRISIQPSPPPGPPLKEYERSKIVSQSVQGPPRAKRLELSTLGGSLSASARWPELELKLWDHEVSVGRDQRVRTQSMGVLYPFGHRALLDETHERDIQTYEATFPPPPIPPPPPPKWKCPNLHHTRLWPRPGRCPQCGQDLEIVEGRPVSPPPGPTHIKFTAAGLSARRQLVIAEPVRQGLLARDFPFDEVEILGRCFDIAPEGGGLLFVPSPAGQPAQPLRFPIRCAGRNGDVFFTVPLVFVRGGEPQSAWEPHSRVVLPGSRLDMVRASPPLEGDVHEVHELKIAGIRDGSTFRPKLTQFTAEMPAVRELLQKSSVRTPVVYTSDYLASGTSVDIAWQPLNPIEIDFTKEPGRSGGLMAPKFDGKKLSRTLGPVPEPTIPLAQACKDATLLGLPLGSLIKADGLQKPPTIVPLQTNPPGVRMTWDLRLQDYGPFKSTSQTSATLTVERSPSKSEMKCTVANFSFVLPTASPLVTLAFSGLTFTQTPGRAPDLKIDGLKIVFAGALQLVRALVDELMLLVGGKGPTINASPSGISAGYTLGLPSVSSGMFLMRNISASFGVNVPFDKNPVSLSLGFARRDNPFNLSVMAFGGGGYIDIQMGPTGLTRLEASMEFGAMVAVNFVIAEAEVHALGGVRFVTSDGAIVLDAFIRIGGSVEVLGLVSVSVELLVVLRYEGPTAAEPQLNRLVGRATLVIEVDVTLFSESVTLDSGEWVLLGPGSPVRGIVPASLDVSDSTRRPAAAALDVERNLTSIENYYEAFV